MAKVFPHLGLGVYTWEPMPKYFIPIVLLSIPDSYTATKLSVSILEILYNFVRIFFCKIFAESCIVS